MVVETAMPDGAGATPRSRRTRNVGTLALFIAAMAMVLGMFAPLVPSASAQWSAPRRVYIEQTGHILDQAFLDLWREGDGATSFGYPITPEITLENGHVVQYFQYARFEYWPEGTAAGVNAFVADIGEELRPLSVRRSVSTFNSFSEPNQSVVSEEVLRVTQAWLEVGVPDAVALATGTRYVEASQHTVRGEFRSFWERTGEAAFLGNPLTEEYVAEGVTYQVFERGQLALDSAGSAYMVPIGQVLADKYGLDQTPVAQGNVPTYSEALFIPPPPPVPGVYGTYVEGGAAVSIHVNLSKQYMVVYQGDRPLGETYVSTGRAGFETPTGTFYINNKYRLDDMAGNLRGETWDVPDVPHVMYFTGVGHAIHGAYWHNDFGRPRSHGCINLPLPFAAWLFDISPSGTRVVITY